MASNQLCGFSHVFIFFNTFITESAGNDAHTVSVFATIMGIISFFTAAFANIIIEKFNRRPLFIIPMGCMAASLLLYAFIGFIDGPSNPLLKYILSIWPLFYRTSVGTLAFIYVAEVLPGIGVSISVFSNWVLAFVSVQSCLPLVKAIGTSGVMFFFGCFCCFACWAYDKYLIESRGRTKAELLELFEKADTREGSFVENGSEMKNIPLLDKSNV